MMITTTYFFGIEERAHVFLPLEFKHHRNSRPLWRTVFFSCLNGVWEWVQVTSDPPSRWSTWEEYLQSKPGEFTYDQIVAEMPQNWLKINRAMARILEMFDWHSTSRLVTMIGHFEHQFGADNPGERWR